MFCKLLGSISNRLTAYADLNFVTSKFEWNGCNKLNNSMLEWNGKNDFMTCKLVWNNEKNFINFNPQNLQ